MERWFNEELAKLDEENAQLRSRVEELEAKLAEAQELVSMARSFQVQLQPTSISICYRGENEWAICSGGHVLNKNGEWEYEPSPSNRGDDFLARTRFAIDEAFEYARTAIDAARGEG